MIYPTIVRMIAGLERNLDVYFVRDTNGVIDPGQVVLYGFAHVRQGLFLSLSMRRATGQSGTGNSEAFFDLL
jgi:hypothetical protein